MAPTLHRETTQNLQTSSHHRRNVQETTENQEDAIDDKQSQKEHRQVTKARYGISGTLGTHFDYCVTQTERL